MMRIMNAGCVFCNASLHLARGSRKLSAVLLCDARRSIAISVRNWLCALHVTWSDTRNALGCTAAQYCRHYGIAYHAASSLFIASAPPMVSDKIT